MVSNELQTDDGHVISIRHWLPETDEAPRAVIQIFHGLGEHAARYERFAKVCNNSGFAVVAHDHRGHGAAADLAGHYADHAGWEKVIADALLVNGRARKHFPGAPIVLLGHSMGSYIAQSFVMRHPAAVSMLILSASTFANRFELRAANTLSSILALFGGQTKSAFLNNTGFSAFNKAFEPARTELDWLSRDEAEVDRYLADPLCGGLFTNQLWRDLTGGLLEITSANAVAAIPREMPILIMGGQDDPVGGEKGLTKLSDVYRQTEHADITLQIYAGGRHEMLNETNRDAVTADIISWIESRL